MEASSKESSPIKWAGGKRRAAASISELFSRKCQGCYYEPFFGGGAVYFYRVAFREVDPKKAFLSDSNKALMNFWRQTQQAHREVGHFVKTLPTEISAESFTAQRDRWNKEYRDQSGPYAAALFYWLNQNCFNGLWRENRKGELNTSVGSRPVFTFDPLPLKEASAMLQGATLEEGDFSMTILPEMVEKTDQIYADPPYMELTNGADFTSYVAEGFTDERHRELSRLLTEASNKGARVIISNHDTPAVRAVYRDFYTISYNAARGIQPTAERTAKEVFLVRGG